MFTRTKAAAMALLSAVSAGIVASMRDLRANHPGTIRRGQDRNPQGIDLFYLSKSYRSNNKYQPHEGKRQQERFARNYGSTEDGTIFPIGRRQRKEIQRLKSMASGSF